MSRSTKKRAWRLRAEAEKKPDGGAELTINAGPEYEAAIENNIHLVILEVERELDRIVRLDA